MDRTLAGHGADGPGIGDSRGWLHDVQLHGHCRNCDSQSGRDRHRFFERKLRDRVSDLPVDQARFVRR